MFNSCPTRMRVGSTLGLADSSASSLTRYWRAMPNGVSPALTVWVRTRLAPAESARARSEAPLATTVGEPPGSVRAAGFELVDTAMKTAGVK